MMALFGVQMKRGTEGKQSREEAEQPMLLMRFEINTNVRLGSAPFTSSRLVTLAPAYIVANISDVPFEVRHHHSEVTVTLLPGERRPWPWFGTAGTTDLLCRPVGVELRWQWSKRFSMSDVGSHYLRVVCESDKGEIIKFSVLPVGITTQVCMRYPMLAAVRPEQSVACS